MNITLYPLHDYNNGSVNPFTIELDGLTREEYQQEIAKGLWEKSKGGNVISTKCDECGHIHLANGQMHECLSCGALELTEKLTNEEWIVCDYEDIPSEYVNEYDLSSDFWSYLELLQTTDLDDEAIQAGIECGIPLESIEEAYSGTFRDDEDFAYEMADSCGLVDENARWPMSCIDWTQAARELMMDYSEDNGHYFSCNY